MGDRSKTANQSVGKRIKAQREINRLTQAELGKLVNKGESTVRMWELEKSEPDLETLSKLADVFNVSTDYLLGRSTPQSDEMPKSTAIPIELQPYQYAFFDGVDGLTDESMKDILKYIEFVKAKENKEKNKS